MAGLTKSERIVKAYFESKGYDVTRAKRAKWGKGVPDFLCKKNDNRIFVEVKGGLFRSEKWTDKPCKLAQVQKWLELLSKGERVHLAFATDWDEPIVIVEIDRQLKEVNKEMGRVPEERIPGGIPCPFCSEMFTTSEKVLRHIELTHVPVKSASTQ